MPRPRPCDLEIMGTDNAELADWAMQTLDFDQLILEYFDPNDPAGAGYIVSYNDQTENNSYTF